MCNGHESARWRSVSWWLAVSLLAVALKHHYSTAGVGELDWMFRPLSQLLEWYTGHAFYRDSDHGWVSEAADVRLVKACAGINFMVMSFVAYAWVLRPDRRAPARILWWTAGRVVLLGGAFMASWMTAVLANSARIIAAMNIDPHGWVPDALGMGAADVHRLTGMAVYLPVLALQTMFGDRGAGRSAFLVPFMLYLLLTVVVPLFTGNALRDPTLFLRHLLTLSAVIIAGCAVAFLCRRWRVRLEQVRQCRQGGAAVWRAQT